MLNCYAQLAAVVAHTQQLLVLQGRALNEVILCLQDTNRPSSLVSPKLVASPITLKQTQTEVQSKVYLTKNATGVTEYMGYNGSLCTVGLVKGAQGVDEDIQVLVLVFKVMHQWMQN